MVIFSSFLRLYEQKGEKHSKKEIFIIIFLVPFPELHYRIFGSSNSILGLDSEVWNTFLFRCAQKGIIFCCYFIIVKISILVPSRKKWKSFLCLNDKIMNLQKESRFSEFLNAFLTSIQEHFGKSFLLVTRGIPFIRILKVQASIMDILSIFVVPNQIECL